MRNISTNYKNLFSRLVNKLIKYPRLITITNLTLEQNLITCAYNFIFATRMHHLSNKDIYFLPTTIIKSFAFKYFSKDEQNFIHACDAYNEAILFSKNHPTHTISNIYSGTEIIILVYNPHNPNNMLKFKINDLSKFTGLCRRYNNPTQAEKIISAIFNKAN